ncbi:MAG: hypothetical protein H0T64_10375 [Pyrinomonadaceae bacterium]|nr:hypothetical protein [Pyrinomonadaceae bacterium]
MLIRLDAVGSFVRSWYWPSLVTTRRSLINYWLRRDLHQHLPAPAICPFDSVDNLEERLLAQVAELDPKLALQNAEQMLEKGQFTRALAQVLAQLQAKDKDAAAKLEDKLVKRLQSANILFTLDAGTLALSLLRPGPRPAESGTTPAPASLSNSPQILMPSTYTSLLGNVIDAALKAVPPPAGSQRRASNFRGRRGGPGGRWRRTEQCDD